MKTRTCTKCGREKPLSEFHKHPQGKFGVRPKCKDCRKISTQSYHRSYEGYSNYLYNSIQGRLRFCDSYSYRICEFNKIEFLHWLFNYTKYDELYEQWFKSGFNRSLAPSIDRIDNDGDYTFDNIQLITVSENSTKGAMETRGYQPPFYIGDILVKKCNDCGYVKPIDNFYKRYESKCGVRGKCKECYRVYLQSFNDSCI